MSSISGSYTRAVLLVVSVLLITSSAWSPPMFMVSRPAAAKGSAAKPYDKKNVAVLGAGGSLGANIVGFLQRAGSLYGTGIANIRSPRCIGATATGSKLLNSILSRNFILAQADESFYKLTDMTSIEAIQDRVRGFDALVMGTRYCLEDRPVTGGTFEKGPNDKTVEFYMDVPGVSTTIARDDPDYSLKIFQNTLEACRLEKLQHVLVVETDAIFDESRTDSIENNCETCIALLEASGISFTYIKPIGKLENFKDYTYAKGLQGDLQVKTIFGGDLAVSGSPNSMYREDLAALCVQSLLSFDWDTSRSISVSCTGEISQDGDKKATRPDREWCVNSSVLAEKLSVL